jgi:hypothetical protein
MQTNKQLTLRLPSELYTKSRKLAKRRGVSLNELAREGLQQLAMQEEQAELQIAYDLLGSDDASDVTPFHGAQAEVILGDD